MRNIAGLSWLFVILLSSCSGRQKPPVMTIDRIEILDSIPSGSGIVVQNGAAYIIGDDATGIYRLDLQTQARQKLAIHGMNFNQYREPKETKHDLECGTMVAWKGKQYLLAFGSGSKSTSRDSLLVLNIEDPADCRIISLQHFYRALQRLTKTDSTQWNIEGCTALNETLVLCNRGNNHVIRFPAGGFLNYILGSDTAIPAIQYQRAQLPFIGNREARLSGISTLDEKHLLFSASVEDTDDWTKDGPVLGSYVGVYSLYDNKVTASFLLQGEDGKPMIEKLESIDILQRHADGSIDVIAIGDNDNGSSKLFRLRMKP